MFDRRTALVLSVIAVATCEMGHAVSATEPGQENPVGLRGRWKQIFAEEFDAQELNAERWTTCYWWNKNGCTNLANKELQWYLPANVQLADGYLRLTARPEQVTGHEGRTYQYTSGMVTTGRDFSEIPRPPRFTVSYGYFEMRAKIPAGRGLWPAFWLVPADRSPRPEIDIMEVIGQRPRVLELHFHYENKDGEVQTVGHQIETSDLSKDWHVYGLRWGPHALTWYLDGVEQWRYTGTGIPHKPMYLIINLAVGGKWPGDPDRGTIFPADFLIDHVRVWLRVGS
jgi:beta-glucanase (GH16 family)